MLTGDTNPIRKIQGVNHFDKYSSFEGDTPEFRSAYTFEIENWNNQDKPHFKKWQKEFDFVLENALPKKEEYAQEHFGRYSIQHTYSHTLNIWIDKKLMYEGVSCFSDSGEYYGIVRDIGDGSEAYELTIFDLNHEKLWSYKNVGPQFVFSKDKVFFTIATNRLWYNRVKTANIHNGKNIQTIFIQTDKRFNTEVYKPPYQETIFIKTYNALHQKIYKFNNTLTLVTDQKSTLQPVSEHTYLTNNSLVPYIDLPTHEKGVDCILYHGTFYIITVNKGKHTLWSLMTNIKKLFTAPHFHFLKNMEIPSIVASYHFKPSEVFSLPEMKNTLTMPCILELEHEEHIVKNIPYTIVWKKGISPKKLIVSAYGAYGIEASREYPIRWLPWINNEWAFAIIMPRGGRDDGDIWYDEGRTAPRKKNTFIDTAHGIQAVQKCMNIEADSTIFYGRSAGGWVAAMIALEYSHLVRGVIAEVPYVDVLRTTSNPKLPLTQLEYDEFGDPLHKKLDYEALLKISPVDIVKHIEPKETIVLLKTALNDSEVASYESLKFGATLREYGWKNVFINIDTNGGHFVGRTKMSYQYAEDAAFYSSFFESRYFSRTRKASSHLSRGTTRRSTSSRKHLIKTATSVSAE